MAGIAESLACAAHALSLMQHSRLQRGNVSQDLKYSEYAARYMESCPFAVPIIHRLSSVNLLRHGQHFLKERMTGKCAGE